VTTDVDGVEYLVEESVQCVWNKLTLDVFIIELLIDGSHQLVHQSSAKVISVIMLYH